jgi:hypothetical protein
VLGGGVVEASFGAALGVAAVEGRRVDGEDRRPGEGSMLDEEATQAVLVDAALAQRLVEAAVAAGELGLQAERRDGGDRPRPAQQRVAELEQRVAP